MKANTNVANRWARLQKPQTPLHTGVRLSLQPWQLTNAADMLEVVVSLDLDPPTSSLFWVMLFDYSEEGSTEVPWCK